MRKIAIITVHDGCFNSYDDYTRIVQSITDWAEVTDEEFFALQNASYRKQFTIIEQQIDQDEFIKRTVAEYLEEVAKEAAKEAERKEKEAAKRRERELKRKAKDAEAEKALLADLLKKHGVPGEAK
jgi:3-methyladenine DNA glycosylase AlkD